MTLAPAQPLAQPLAPAARIAADTPAWRHAGFALFLAGFSSFALIYCVQPLLPTFAAHFGRTPATASLALSLTTGALAVAIVATGALAQTLSRKAVMLASMLAAAVLNLAAAAAPDWQSLLIARALEGLALGGVPAVAMAWLAEEIEPRDLGRAMGLYIAGTAFGAMMGRVGMGVLTEFADWRVAMAGLGALCLAAAIGFAWLLPAARPRTAAPRTSHLALWARHLANPALRRAYATGFCLTSVFVTVFNYATFRLAAAPYSLGQTALSLIFLAFGFGIVSATVAGRLADRLGRRPLLIAAFVTILAGLAATLAAALWAIFAGIGLITTGFFIGHAVASGSVGAEAEGAKGHASALYLLFYYAGSALTGSAGGWLWAAGGWPAVAALCAAAALGGIALAATGARRG